MKHLMSLRVACLVALVGAACGDDSGAVTPEPRSDAGVARADAAVVDAGKTVRDASRPVVDSGSHTPQGNDDDCSGAAKLVYVVDKSGKLSSFHPDTLAFADIGQLACATDGSSPFSMSVDRTGTAWVLYDSGQLYAVSTEDASCKPIDRPIGAANFAQFGMGFVGTTDAPDDDKLFIAGTPPLDLTFNLTPQLGFIDPVSLNTTKVGALSGSDPELTGTGDGKLWAFYAQDTPPSLKRLDPTSAAVLESHPLDTIKSLSATSWAVAFWGGDLWLFLQGVGAASTSVYQVDGTSFTQKEVVPNTGRVIVGAGVSTCAPLVQLL